MSHRTYDDEWYPPDLYKYKRWIEDAAKRRKQETSVEETSMLPSKEFHLADVLPVRDTACFAELPAPTNQPLSRPPWNWKELWEAFLDHFRS